MLLSVIIQTANALPPPRSYEAVQTLEDDKRLIVTVVENGRFTTYTAEDGKALLRDEKGVFYYATKDENGRLVPSAFPAVLPNMLKTEEREWLMRNGVTSSEAAALLECQNPRKQLYQMSQSRSGASTPDGLGSYKQSALGVVKSIGSPRIPVIMAAFSDVAFSKETTKEKVTRFLNEEGYHDEPLSVGSVRDYFVSQSQGLFSPTFEVIAEVKVEGTRSSYGKDGSSGATDPNGTAYIRDAVAEAAKTVDFKPYAAEDGFVPFVAVIYPGPGQQSSFEDGKTNYLWAKFSGGHSIPTSEGGPTVKSFIMANELIQSYGTGPNDITGAAFDGVGLFAHEFGHALGLPDMYYTGKDATIRASLLTMDYWDIMDYGQYFMNGYAPPGYTAYERSNLGWLKVEPLTEAAFVRLSSYDKKDETAKAYVLRNPINEKEYFLLENRTVSTWYPKALGEGMLISHIDYDAQKWAANTVNNDPDRQRIAYVPADGVKDGTSTKNTTLQQLLDGYKGDLYPGTTGVTSFTSESKGVKWQTPESPAYELPLFNIVRTEDGLITFSFIDSTLDGIADVMHSSSDMAEPVYTLTGLRVRSINEAAPGIYITAKGRKILKTKR